MTMNTIARTATRRVISNASRRNVSTLRQGENDTRRAIVPLMAVSATVGGLGYFLQQQDNKSYSQCLSKETTAEAVNDKFATYWPRNIMILFGPPVS